MDYDEIQRKVAHSSNELVELHATVRQLQTRIDRQAVVIQYLKDMVLAQTGFSEEQFHEGVTKLATRKADKTCRKCGKVVSAKHNRCMFCGELGPREVS